MKSIALEASPPSAESTMLLIVKIQGQEPALCYGISVSSKTQLLPEEPGTFDQPSLGLARLGWLFTAPVSLPAFAYGSSSGLHQRAGAPACDNK